MLIVALRDKNGLRTDYGSSLVSGKLKTCSQSMQYIIAYPNLLEDQELGSRFCQASVYQMMKALNDFSFLDSKIISTNALKTIVEQVITDGWQILQKENLLGVSDLVVVLAHGNRIAVGSSSEFSAFFRRNGSLLQLPRKTIDPAQIKLHGLSPGHIIGAKTLNEDRFFAIAPSTFNLNSQVHQLLSGRTSSEDCLTELARVLPADEKKSNQLILGFSFPERSKFPTTGKNILQDANGKSGSTTVEDQESQFCKSHTLVKQLKAIEEGINNLTDRIVQLPAELPVDDRPWETLLERLKKYEQQEIDQHVIQPLLHRLILIYDLIASADRTASEYVLGAVEDELLETLSMYGVEQYSTPEPRFDSKVQKCIGNQKTPSPTGDGLVAEKVRDGFRRGNQILRFEEVIVYRYEPPGFSQEGETPWQLSASTSERQIH